MCAPLCSPYLVLSHSSTALSLCVVSILIVKLSRKHSALSHTLSLSLPFCQCDLSSPTQVYTMRIILSWYQNFCLFSFVLHTHTHTYSLPLTHPRLLLLPINFCCSCFRRRSALTTRRRDVAASSRMCCVFCVCVCARCRRRRCRCRCVFFVVASSSSRACCCCMQGRLRTNFNIIWRSSFAHSAAAFARSLAVCVSFVCSLSFSLACFECSLLFDFSCRLASWVRVVVPAKNKWCALVETGQQVWNEYN